MREPEGSNLLVSGLAIAAEVLSSFQAGIAVLLQEAQEIVALDEIQLAGLCGFGGDLVKGCRKRWRAAREPRPAA